MQRGLQSTVRSIQALVLICLVLPTYCQFRIDNSSSLRIQILDSAKADIGIREITGRNDHPKIALWNSFANVPINSPYCASWIVYKYYQNNATSIPKSAWSPSLIPSTHRIRWKGITLPGKSLRQADVLGLYFVSKKRIAHVGLFHYQLGDFIFSYEANTSITAISGSEQDRDATTGGGVTHKSRHSRTWYGAASFINK